MCSNLVSNCNNILPLSNVPFKCLFPTKFLQVLLAWGIYYGMPVLPKSVNEGRIKQNLDTFNVKLLEEDMKALENIGKKFRYLKMSIFYLEGETPKIYWDGEQ